MKRFFAALVLGFAACSGDSGAAAVGSYALDTEALKASFPPFGKLPKDVVDRLAGTLELHADHTSRLAMTLPMVAVDENGTWTLERDLVRVVTTKGGREEVKNGQLKDGAIVFASEQGPMRLELVFRRR